MSNQQQPVAEISEEQVVAYLKDNPAFFIDQDDLLAQLRIPHMRGSSISLVERQVAVLRERNIDMRKRLAHLMDVARDNDRLFDKTRRLILEMLDAQTLDELIGVVDDSLRHSFMVPFVGLTLFSDKQISVGRSQTLKSAQQQIGGLLVGGKALCGVLRPKELCFLFGNDQAEEIKSAAVVALEYQGLQGVLAVGSSDQQHYSNSVDTLFLTYIADVLARLLPTMLASLRAVK
ncbi:MAG TPA: DUF484 family protein [Gammaproteobacteria bacterium]|nr:DUF484 family protein [Gammaproteobacteria bacterium]